MAEITSIMPLIWTGLIIFFAILEAFTLGLTSIWFSLAGIIALLVSFFNVPPFVQGVVFSVTALIFVLYTRPVAKRYLHVGASKTNVNALLGEKGILLKNIDQYNTGQVKVKGQIWTAKSEKGENLYRGEEVEIISVEGVKLVVKGCEDTFLQDKKELHP